MVFLAGHSGGSRNIWATSFHLLSIISMDNGLVPVKSFCFWLVILRGHLMSIASFDRFETIPMPHNCRAVYFLPLSRMIVFLSFA